MNLSGPTKIIAGVLLAALMIALAVGLIVFRSQAADERERAERMSDMLSERSEELRKAQADIDRLNRAADGLAETTLEQNDGFQVRNEVLGVVADALRICRDDPVVQTSEVCVTLLEAGEIVQEAE